MTTEHRPASEVEIDEKFLLVLLQSPGFTKKIKRGVQVLKSQDEESAFSVGIAPSGEPVLSSQVVGETKIYAKSVDDYFLNGPSRVSSVNFKDARFPKIQGLERVADFHFHYNGIMTPSYNDAEVIVKRVYGNQKNKIPVHKRFFGGIFASTNQQLFFFFYGLGKSGLISTDYQAWDSVNSASGYKGAMERSGFWFVEGMMPIGQKGELVWEESIVSELANKLVK